jgi:NTF2 fold immunity protein
MVARFVIAFVLLLTGLSLQATSPLPGVGRTFGPVPDEATAIRIAVTVWEPLYGKQGIASERPFHATLSHGVWHVRGTLPRGLAGGVAEADIRRSDGKVLRIMHGR